MRASGHVDLRLLRTHKFIQATDAGSESFGTSFASKAGDL